jgi:hypothetical protein
MNTTNNLIGKKIKGFKFDDDKYKYGYTDKMDKHIGVVGIIKEYTQGLNAYLVDFENEDWLYPAELIEQHLVEETPLDDLPIIGDGVLMEVSDDNNEWHKRIVFAKYDKYFLAHDGVEDIKKIDYNISPYSWNYARPIPKTKITRKEFESKFEIID